MSRLTQEICQPCYTSCVQLNQSDIEQLSAETPQWEIFVDSNVNSDAEEKLMKLRRAFSFANYQSALDFTNKIARLADEHDHHPAILLEWRQCTITWWTHTLRGLHRNDFILAAKTDQVFGNG